MASLNLPEDLISFLQNGRQLEYDPAACDVGKATLVPLDGLKVELFPMHEAGPEDPHLSDSGSYLVEGVSLIASCDNYGPEGLLLWLPLDERFGLWDGDHGNLFVFNADVNWSHIAADFPHYIEAHWALPGTAAVAGLVPWIRHPYNAEQLHHPLPDLDEWYEAEWTRRGAYKNGVQLRWPEQIQVRIEIDHERREVISQTTKAEEAATWSEPVTRSLSQEEWERTKILIDTNFWAQPSCDPQLPQGESATYWSMTGFRGRCYHRLARSYPEGQEVGDPAHELGKHMAGLAQLRHFQDET